MIYKELISKLEANNKDFDLSYTLKHMTVDECFNSDLAYNKDWNDIADVESIKELN